MLHDLMCALKDIQAGPVVVTSHRWTWENVTWWVYRMTIACRKQVSQKNNKNMSCCGGDRICRRWESSEGSGPHTWSENRWTVCECVCVVCGVPHVTWSPIAMSCHMLCTGSFGTAWRSTVKRRLTTAIRSEKCVVWRFRRCANVIQCTYTNLDSTV
jgi:hypothetical protein